MTVPGAEVIPQRIQVVDSHTEGEPTRVVIDGWPPLAGRTMVERRADVAARFGHLWRSVVCEPRGHDAIVGALLTPPVNPGSAYGVIYFDDAGVIGMCGHGTIGVVRTLQHLGRITTGRVRLDTAVGTVSAEINAAGIVTIENVPAHVHALDVPVTVPGVGRITGDVVWGGNWFFLTHVPGLAITLSATRELTRVTMAIRDALRASGITGADGGSVDHIELGGPPARPDADARNFMLCPGVAYDRSPCGTGTSAIMAARHARGELPLGARWRQQGITGTVFVGWLEQRGADLIPFIQGRAWITGETTLHFESDDPFRWGIPSADPTTDHQLHEVS
jgi:4-hydroxyproline epimerase